MTDDKKTYRVELDIDAIEWMIKMINLLNEAKAGMGPHDWHLPDDIVVHCAGEPSNFIIGMSEIYDGQYALHEEYPSVRL